MERLEGFIFGGRMLAGSNFTDVNQDLGDQASPAGLMAGATAAAGVAMEIFVEWNQIAPMRIFVKKFIGAEERAIAILIPQENVSQSVGQFVSDFANGLQLARARWTFNLKCVAIIAMILAER